MGRGSGGGAGPHNINAMLSFWSAIVALVLLLVFASTQRAEVLIAVPVLGLVGTVNGLIGAMTAKVVGTGRKQSVIGLVLGVGVLIVSGLVALFVWEVTSSQWQF